MNELDLLKKDWNKQKNFPNISEKEIYNMIHKKSSSIVKWIFIISVLEILLWAVLSIVLSDEKQKKMIDDYHLSTFMDVATIIHWAVLVIFVYFFYRNFRNISVISSSKTLMNSILKVRKVVQYYVWYNIIVGLLCMIVIFVNMMMYDNKIKLTLNDVENSDKETMFWVISIVIIGLILLAMSALMWVFYRIIYGILLKRLYQNYKELEKIEL
jgi:hypothetical protein